ncbi:MAG: molybdate ABC transporter substrate-binding protein [Casimicrobiaceae bacterium]
MTIRLQACKLAATLALAVLAFAPATHAAPPNIAAASDLQFVLTEIAESFRRSTGQDLKIAFGSSGNFRRQIAEGAPFEMFLSADEAYVEALAAEGRTEDAGVRYATGRIVLFVPTGSSLKADATLADLGAAARDGRLRRLAIANPEHAPYGRAAREALQKAGIWPQVAPKLALGENVSQAAQFASSGAAQAGIVANSLARSPALAGKGESVLLSSTLHAPLHQRMVLTRRASPVARAFFAYLQQPAARAVFRRYGFSLPES